MIFSGNTGAGTHGERLKYCCARLAGHSAAMDFERQDWRRDRTEPQQPRVVHAQPLHP